MNAVSVALAVAALGLSMTTAYAAPRNPDGALLPVEHGMRDDAHSSVVRSGQIHHAAAPIAEGRQAAPIASSGISPADQWVIDHNRPRDHR